MVRVVCWLLTAQRECRTKRFTSTKLEAMTESVVMETRRMVRTVILVSAVSRDGPSCTGSLGTRTGEYRSSPARREEGGGLVRITNQLVEGWVTFITFCRFSYTSPSQLLSLSSPRRCLGDGGIKTVTRQPVLKHTTHYYYCLMSWPIFKKIIIVGSWI